MSKCAQLIGIGSFHLIKASATLLVPLQGRENKGTHDIILLLLLVPLPLLLPVAAILGATSGSWAFHVRSHTHSRPLGHVRGMEAEKPIILPKVIQQEGSIGRCDSRIATLILWRGRIRELCSPGSKHFIMILWS